MQKMAVFALIAIPFVLGQTERSSGQQTTRLGPEVKKLLTTGWDRSKDGRDAAAAQYERLGELAPGDRRVKYAYALVQMRQMKYREAVALLDEVLDSGDHALVPRQARIWLLMMIKQYDRVLVEMPELAKRLPKDDTVPDARKHEAMAAFLGRICGYLSEPAKSQIDEVALGQCRDMILPQLSPKQRATFDQAEQGVVSKFSGAAEQARADAARAKEEAAVEKEKKVEELKERSVAAAETLADQQQRLDQKKKEFDYKIREISEQQRKAALVIQQIEVAMVQLQREVSILEQRVAELVQLAEQEEDPVRKQVYLNTASRWQVDRNRVIGVLAERERQHVAMRRELTVLTQQRLQAQQEMAHNVAGMEQYEKNVQRAQATHAVASNAAVTGQTAGVRHQRRRSAAFSTYVPIPFSLDAEAKRAIGWFQ